MRVKFRRFFSLKRQDSGKEKIASKTEGNKQQHARIKIKPNQTKYHAHERTRRL
jgi:hypothetical protein